MSEERTAQMLNYLSAISREVGEFRQEFNQFRQEANTRLAALEEQFKIFKLEQRQMSQTLSRAIAVLVATNADVGELQDRVTLLEGKGT